MSTVLLATTYMPKLWLKNKIQNARTHYVRYIYNIVNYCNLFFYAADKYISLPSWQTVLYLPLGVLQMLLPPSLPLQHGGDVQPLLPRQSQAQRVSNCIEGKAKCRLIHAAF